MPSDRAIQLAYKDLELPKGVEWYECNGQVVFPIYGQSVGLVAAYYACLIRREGTFRTEPTWKGDDIGEIADRPKWFGAGIKVNLSDDSETAKTKMAEALTRFIEFDANGGPLPVPPGGF